MQVALDPAVDAEIARLLAAGEHAAAAAALRHHGQHARAAGIYERLFEHGHAVTCYEAAGDLPAAVRAAIVMGDTSAIARLVHEAIARGQGDSLISSLQKAGRHAEVGRVLVARGELHAASQAFVAGEAYSDAARCHEELGEAREAGLLLERHLERHPNDDDAALRLGRVLARFGRHDDAIALLQRALRASAPQTRDALVCRTSPTMTLAFLALGYEDAARATIAAWQKSHKARRRTSEGEGEARVDDDVREAPPSSLEHFMQSPRAAAFSLVQERPAAEARKPRSTPPSNAVDDQMDALFSGTSSPSSSSPEATGPVSDDAEQKLLLAGRYLLGEPLGGGGVGQVFRAYDAFSDRAVAVKIFGAQALSSQAVSQWAKEVRAASNLDHPALVRLVELNMAQGFVVTELCDDDDGAVLLEERLRQGGDGYWLKPAMLAVADVLAACHRTGLVHGGLKPQNVFLVPGGVKLVDTGAHRLLALRATETGGLSSVWPYLSPELLFGAAADVDGDLYALAAIAYRALTGQPPFPHATADRKQAPARADVVNPAVPRAWADLLARALSPDKAERFDSADAFKERLPTEPLTLVLPPAALVGDVSTTSGPARDKEQRYLHERLREKSDSRLVKEGRDTLVGRPVWLVQRAESAHDDDALFGLAYAARLWRGVQPIYDLVVDERGRATFAVLARDHSDTRCDYAALRRVPQGLARDLVAVAVALQALHKHGVALGGFDVDRASGPIGPRLRLAPAPPLVQGNDDAVAADWASFGALVGHAFDAAVDATLDDRGRFLAALHNGSFLERDDLSALARERDAPWPRFLELVADMLVRGAQARTVARLVSAVVQGR